MHDAAERVDDDDLRDVAAQPVRRDDAVARVRPFGLGPPFVEAAAGERRDRVTARRDADETRGAGEYLFGDDGAVGANVGVRQPFAEGEPLLLLSALDEEVGPLLIRIHELDLREEQAAVGERKIGRAAVAPTDSVTRPRRVDAVGAEGLATGPAAIENGRVTEPAGIERVGSVARELSPRLERTGAGLADRARDRVAELAPGLGERDAESAARRRVEQIWNEVFALRLHELSDRGIAARLREVIHEERAVRVRGFAEWVASLPQAPRADARKSSVDCRRARDHAMLGPLDAPGAGEIRLLVDRHSLEEPRRRVEIREGRRRAAEDVLAQRPDAAHAIELEDVRQLVRDHHLCPIVRVAKRALVHRRIGVDDDAVRRERARGSVREVDVVAERDVDHAARRVHLARELVVRPLRVGGETARQRLERRVEIDAEVARREGAPGEVGSLGARGAGNEREGEGKGGRAQLDSLTAGRLEPACCLAVQLSSRPAPPHCAIDRKYASIPSATPRA